MAIAWIDFQNGKYDRRHGDLTETEYKAIAVGLRAQRRHEERAKRGAKR